MAEEQSPEEWAQSVGRESYHWGTIPEAYRNIPGIMGAANDKANDPNAFAQSFLASQRQQGLTDAGDAAALSGQGWLGGAAPKPQVPSQQSTSASWMTPQWSYPHPTTTPQPAATQAPSQPGQAPIQSVSEMWANPAISQQIGGQEQTNQARNDQLFNMWTQGMRDPSSVSASNPIIKSQVDAYRNEQERARRNFISDSAEKYGPLANIQGEERMAAEQAGANTSGYQAQLMGQELSALREETMQRLAQATQMNATDSARSLQERLAMIDAQLQTTQFGLQQQGMNNDWTLAQQGFGMQQQGLDQDWQRAQMNNDMSMRQLGFQDWDRNMYYDLLQRGLI